LLELNPKLSEGLKPGMPGVVYLQTDANAKWPAVFPVR
jgi:hypothetical protein